MKNCRFENLEKYKKKWTRKYGEKAENGKNKNTIKKRESKKHGKTRKKLTIKRKIKNKIKIEKLKLKSGNNYKNYCFSENKTFIFSLQKI